MARIMLWDMIYKISNARAAWYVEQNISENILDRRCLWVEMNSAE